MYSSQGGHASYPLFPTAGVSYLSDEPGAFPMVADDEDGSFHYPCLGDPGGKTGGVDVPTHDKVDMGTRWQTWNSLEDAREQPWWSFGGAWGHAGRFSFSTGPLGPPHAPEAPSGW